MTPARRRALVLTGAASAAGVGALGLYVGSVTGAVTVDLGIGRRTRPLGPLTIAVHAPREQVYAAAAAPYAERRPRALREKVDILDRAGPMMLAAHRTPLRTPLGRHLTAVTVETVVLQPPEQIRFGLVRGPVPLVEETFRFDEADGVTTLTYTGVLGTDLWALGEAWGAVVARTWVNTVRATLDQIQAATQPR